MPSENALLVVAVMMVEGAHGGDGSGSGGTPSGRHTPLHHVIPHLTREQSPASASLVTSTVVG
jgi:hypothetical protein